MKKILTIAFLLLFALAFNPTAQAQDELKWPAVDKSVMDMAYYPSRIALRAFAKTDAEKNAEPKIRVIYSRPLKKGRKVFGDLEKFGKPWRAGANESTEILFYQNVEIGGTKVKKGRYTIHVVPTEKEWEVHFSTDVDRWGSYSFDPAESTVAKIKVSVEKAPETIEAFSIMFKGADDGAHMLMGWDDTMVRVPINF